MERSGEWDISCQNVLRDVPGLETCSDATARTTGAEVLTRTGLSISA